MHKWLISDLLQYILSFGAILQCACSRLFGKKKNSYCLISFYPIFLKKLNGKIIIIKYGLSCQLHDTDRERLAAFTLREGADQLTLLSFLETAGRSPLFLFLCFFLGTRFFYSFNYLSNILYNAIFFFLEKIYDAILVSYFIYKFFKSGNLLVYILKKKKKGNF